MRIIAPALAPHWFIAFLRDLQQALRGPSDQPIRLQTFADAAALPSAADWSAGIVYVADITMVAVSDGSDWRRLDTGAVL